MTQSFIRFGIRLYFYTSDNAKVLISSSFHSRKKEKLKEKIRNRAADVYRVNISYNNFLDSDILLARANLVLRSFRNHLDTDPYSNNSMRSTNGTISSRSVLYILYAYRFLAPANKTCGNIYFETNPLHS